MPRNPAYLLTVACDAGIGPGFVLNDVKVSNRDSFFSVKASVLLGPYKGCGIAVGGNPHSRQRTINVFPMDNMYISWRAY